MKDFSPIIIFAYNRPIKLLDTLNALAKNKESSESLLYICCDGLKNDFTKEDKYLVEETRSIAKLENRFKNTKVIELNSNQGLAKSIIAGINFITSFSDNVIVLEDDIVTSPYFLKFMNEALSIYQNDFNVASICGYWYPINLKKNETIFLRCSSSWGWATWKRAWVKFELDGNKLLNQIKINNLGYKFNLNNSINYVKMLEDQVFGKNDSWAIRWYASIFLNNMYCLYPRESLVNNIGFDGTGVHSGVSRIFDTIMIEKPIKVSRIPVTESKLALKKLINFYYNSKLKHKLFILFKKIKSFFK